MQKVYRFIWNISEFTGIGLGRLAPKIFEGMIGIKGKRIKEKDAL